MRSHQFTVTGLAGVALVVTTAIVIAGCSPSATRTPAAPPTASQDATASIVGTWIPRVNIEMKSLEIDRAGVTQVLRAGGGGLMRNGILQPMPESRNRGSWQILAPDLLFAELNTKGFGVPRAVYRFSTTKDTLTLVFLAGQSWITGSDHPTVEFARKK
jgi:hypothetical protein